MPLARRRVARQLHAAPATAALLVTATQLGSAAGLYLLVPLGDRVRPRLLASGRPRSSRWPRCPHCTGRPA